MLNVFGRRWSVGRFLRRVQSVWPLTIRRRIILYLIVGALAGLACGGVDYQINANSMEGDAAVDRPEDCSVVFVRFNYCATATYINGKCHLTGCVHPPDTPSKPITNCGFGKKNGTVPWTSADCRNQVQFAGCAQGTLYPTSGCFGYYCSDLRCGK